MAALQADNAMHSAPVSPSGRSRLRAILLPAVVVGAPCALFFYNASYARTLGRLVADPQTVDLGAAPEGETIDAMLELVNPTRVPVELTDVKAGCRCTVVHWERVVVRPGERLEIPLELTVPLGNDTFIATVDVQYAQNTRPDAPRLAFKVHFRTTVVHDYRLTRSELDFTGHAADTPLSLVLEGAARPDIDVLACRTTSAAYACLATQLDQAPNRWRIDVLFDPAQLGPSDFAEAQLLIMTSSQRYPEIKVRLFSGDRPQDSSQRMENL